MWYQTYYSSNYDDYKRHCEETKQYGFDKQDPIFIIAEECRKYESISSKTKTFIYGELAAMLENLSNSNLDDAKIEIIL